MKKLRKLKAQIISDGCNGAFHLYRFLRKYISVHYVIEGKTFNRNQGLYDLTFICVNRELDYLDLNKLNTKQIIAFETHEYMYSILKNKLIDELEGRAKYYLKHSFYKEVLDNRFSYRNLPLAQCKDIPRYFFRAKKLRHRKIGVDFIGNISVTPNQLTNKHYAQRLEWLQELTKQTKFPFSGGLTSPENTRYFATELNMPELLDAAKNYYIDRIPFKQFYSRLLNTQISLCPSGVSRWTYRHIQAMLTKSVVFSTELRNVETFPSFPLEQFIIAKDYEKITDLVDNCLSNIERYQEQVDYVQHYWNSYYNNGRYGQEKLFVEFMKQFEFDL